MAPAPRHHCCSSTAAGTAAGTADAYRTEPEFFPMGHNLMLAAGWPDVATRIHDWLQTRDQRI